MSLADRIRASSERIRAVEAALPARGLVSDDPWRVIGDPGEPGWVPVDGYVASHYGGSFFGHPAVPVAYFRDAIGFVHLRGQVALGFQSLFYLPPGYRPITALRIPVASNLPEDARFHATLTLNLDGLVRSSHWATVGGFWASLDGVSFPTHF